MRSSASVDAFGMTFSNETGLYVGNVILAALANFYDSGHYKYHAE